MIISPNDYDEFDNIVFQLNDGVITYGSLAKITHQLCRVLDTAPLNPTVKSNSVGVQSGNVIIEKAHAAVFDAMVMMAVDLDDMQVMSEPRVKYKPIEKYIDIISTTVKDFNRNKELMRLFTNWIYDVLAPNTDITGEPLRSIAAIMAKEFIDEGKFSSEMDTLSPQFIGAVTKRWFQKKNYYKSKL